MTASVRETEQSSTYDVRVVALTDGRLGFMAPDAWPDRAVPAALEWERVRREGSAVLLRSGPAYEEVRGRLRVGSSVLRRWRLRRDRPVVVVTTPPDNTAQDPGAAQDQVNRPSAR